ncbi:hypothetical protein ACQ4PT_020075 [Festuca glaucescens]
MAAGERNETAVATAPLLAPARGKERCPACRLAEINMTSTSIPYRNFFYVWVVCLCACLGVLVYQLTIYPFLAKYAGLIKPFRSAAVLSILLLATYPFMANLYGMELKVLINIASLLKNVFAATITIACNILQNTAVAQEQRGVANGISVTLMSIFKAVAPAAAGILFSWAQKNITGLFLPGDQILFWLLNMVSVLGLSLTLSPFFSMPSAMK